MAETMTDDKAKVGAALRLPEGRSLPDLRIVPRAEVHLHEDTDPARVQRLVTRLRTEGVLRNPLIAAPRSDGGFVILDGANRTTALLALEAPAVLLQVVEYEDPAVRLDVWCHLLAQPVDLPGLLRARGLSIREISRAPVKLPAGITRHLIPGRALRVNLPLDVLTSPGEIEQKNRWLADEIHRRLLENRIRYYPESSFLFDE